MQKREYLNTVARYCLILAGVTVGATFISGLTGGNAIAGTVIQLLKTFISITVLYKACREFASRESAIRTGPVFGFAYRTSMLSNVAISLFSLLWYTINPIDSSAVMAAVEMYPELIAGPDMEATVNMLTENFPEYYALSMLFYLTVVSLIISLVVASSAKEKNPFRQEEDNDDII